jgi:RNA polymerase sigma-70 factor, ECF subfamily
MERHAAPVFHFLCRMVGNEDDANDLAQETFARVFRARASFRLNEKFSTWLYTIAANLARNHFRWRARHPNISLETAADDPEQSLENVLPAKDAAPSEQIVVAERAVAVRAEVARLPEDLREALVLCEWEERSVAETALILETTPKAVESRLYRARKQLRARLQGWR